MKQDIKGLAIPIDVYNKDGELVRIEFTQGDGTHIIDVVWDDRDAQTSENRTAFRKWAYTMLRQMNWEVSK